MLLRSFESSPLMENQTLSYFLVVVVDHCEKINCSFRPNDGQPNLFIVDQYGYSASEALFVNGVTMDH